MLKGVDLLPDLASLALGILQWPFRSRQQRLMADRVLYTRSEFAQFFLERDVPRPIVDETWNALVEAAVIPGFRPKPEDELLATFGLADEDLDEDVVLRILERCGCRIPTPDEVMHSRPFKTVADLVEFATRMSQ